MALDYLIAHPEFGGSRHVILRGKQKTLCGREGRRWQVEFAFNQELLPGDCKVCRSRLEKLRQKTKEIEEALKLGARNAAELQKTLEDSHISGYSAMMDLRLK